MKLILTSLICVGLTWSGSCEGLLPPFWESVSQIKAILESHDLSNFFDSSEVIEFITQDDEGYLIVTNKSTVKAIIKAKPQSMPGPAIYEVNFTK